MKHYVILHDSDLIIGAIQQAIISKYDDFDEDKDSCIISFFLSKTHWSLYHVIRGYAYSSCYQKYIKKIGLDEQKFFCDIDESKMDSYHKKQLKEAFDRMVKDTELRVELITFLLSIEKITSSTQEFLQKRYDLNKKRYEED